MVWWQEKSAAVQNEQNSWEMGRRSSMEKSTNPELRAVGEGSFWETHSCRTAQPEKLGDAPTAIARGTPPSNLTGVLFGNTTFHIQ